jgi:hypothetical protein
MNIYRLINRLMVVGVFLPPVYIAYRFLRWYLKQEQEGSEA